jgi:hypothetical protein
METIDAIKLWKEKKIMHCEMEFSCGGDSMNDYTFRYFTEDDSFEDAELTDGYFDDSVYKNINFYVNSDGHYMGEQGVVQIVLEEGDEDFTYSKTAQSEWNETIENELLIQLTDEQAEFIRKNVSDINGGYDEGVNINYSRSFIMTDREEELQKELELLIEGDATNFEPDTDEELQEWYRFESGESISINENNQLLIIMRNETYVYTDSEE